MTPCKTCNTPSSCQAHDTCNDPETRLINHIESISCPVLREICRTVPNHAKFKTVPASLSFHHAYEGGLLAHTVEVCDLAMHAQSYSGGSRDVLLAAALFHDIKKTEEYLLVMQHEDEKTRMLVMFQERDWKTGYVHTDYGKTIGHIAGSAAHFQTIATSLGLNQPTIDAVVHCILAHHGPVREWGSPVAPQTLEALLLHQADLMSAGYGKTKDAP